jgi:hypothetical protein
MEHPAVDRLSRQMREYLARQENAFVSSCDRDGVCHASVQSGPPGFVRVLSDATLMCPEYAGDGLIAENAGPVALLFVDSSGSGHRLTISGRARAVVHDAVEVFAPLLRTAGIDQIVDVVDGRPLTPARWLLVSIASARMDAPAAGLPRGRPVPPAVAAPIAADAPVPTVPPTDGPSMTAGTTDDDELTYLLPPAWLDA